MRHVFLVLGLVVLLLGCSHKSKPVKSDGWFSRMHHIQKQHQKKVPHSGKNIQQAKRYKKDELLKLLDSEDISGLDKCFQYVFDQDNTQLPEKYKGHSDYWDIEILEKVKALRKAGKC